MKTAMLLFAVVVLTLVSSFVLHAQGSGVISFGNVNVTDDRRIWVCDSAGMVRASGNAYQIALYWGQVGTPEFGLVQVGSPVGFLSFAPGTFSGGNRTVMPLANDGDIVTVQARAWKQLPGVANSYEAVLAAGLAGDSRAEIGRGPVFDFDTSRPGDPTDPPYAIGTSSGWRGFSVGVLGCPEPSTVTLSVLGGAALLLIRARTRGKSGA